MSEKVDIDITTGTNHENQAVRVLAAPQWILSKPKGLWNWNDIVDQPWNYKDEVNKKQEKGMNQGH
uniref:Uncharacterized protein n=1 Tax=Megaselia scalaris TaxID=36166 RepID=T1GNS2_MEGSC